MATSIKEILLSLKEQAIGWTVLGISVLIFYPVIVFNWDVIDRFNLLFPIGLFGIAGTTIWWFWTMRIIFQLLKLRQEETVSFEQILEELRSIRKELKKDLDKNRLH